MASKLEDDLCCPICHELYTSPVLLSCSHSFCNDCLQNWWKGKFKKTCPVCKRRSSREFPPSNLALRNLVETFLEQRGEMSLEQRVEMAPEQPLCSIHSEKLKLFCKNHKQPVCLICKDSKTHKGHRFSPIDEAAQDLRKRLQTAMKPLKNKLKVLKGKEEQFGEAVAHIKTQAQQTEKQIQDQFEELQRFLLEEKESRMKALKEEEEQKTQRMKDKVVAVSKDRETVSKTIAETEELLRASDTSFLHQYKAAEERVQRCHLLEEQETDDEETDDEETDDEETDDEETDDEETDDEETDDEDTGDEETDDEETQDEKTFDQVINKDDFIDQAKHLGNLGYNIWRKMKSLVQFSPVVLDPNTAGCELFLSADLTSVSHGERQKLPQNPERLQDDIIFASEALTSGTHSWDIEVGDNEDWVVGVTGPVQEDGEDGEDGEDSDDDEESELERWYIEFSDGEYTAVHSPDTNKSLSAKNLQRVRVKLDFNRKTVSFSDPDSNTELHIFAGTFPEELIPFLGTEHDVPLKILPENITIKSSKD